MPTRMDDKIYKAAKTRIGTGGFSSKHWLEHFANRKTSGSPPGKALDKLNKLGIDTSGKLTDSAADDLETLQMISNFLPDAIKLFVAAGKSCNSLTQSQSKNFAQDYVDILKPLIKRVQLAVDVTKEEQRRGDVVLSELSDYKKRLDMFEKAATKILREAEKACDTADLEASTIENTLRINSNDIELLAQAAKTFQAKYKARGKRLMEVSNSAYGLNVSVKKDYDRFVKLPKAPTAIQEISRMTHSYQAVFDTLQKAIMSCDKSLVAHTDALNKLKVALTRLKTVEI
ncbi:MAG: hypothetical protein AAGB05_00370 [Pseudomonadota bacterium]